MKFMLDANILIALMSGEPAVLLTNASMRAEGEIVISAIAFAEVALGSLRGKRPSLLSLDLLGQRLPILPFDHLAAKCYAQLPFKRGSFDRLIGAHALSLGVTLVTNNVRDFADIPNLHLEDWTL